MLLWVRSPVTDIFVLVAHILAPIANVFKAISPSTIVFGVPYILALVANILTSVADIFLSVMDILMAVTHLTKARLDPRQNFFSSFR